MATIHAFDYLEAPPEGFPPAAVCVLFGDDAFLRRLARQRLRQALLGDDESLPFVTFAGDAALWRDVHAELCTHSLFGGGRRLVVIEEADPLVSKQRDKLEGYAERPSGASVLVLEVSSWAGNTRLYKLVDKTGLQIECRPPMTQRGRWKSLDEARIAHWLSDRAGTEHGFQLPQAAAKEALSLVGPELGLLDQELAKLALFLPPKGKADAGLVREVVGGWRLKTVWEIIDHALDGDAAEAIAQLDRVLLSGEKPQALFGQISWSLRRFAAATRIFERSERTGRRLTLRDALDAAGFKGKMADAALPRLQQLGRQRAGAFYQWLLEADLAMKGSHSQDDRARLVLELLFVRMAKQADPRRLAAERA